MHERILLLLVTLVGVGCTPEPPTGSWMAQGEVASVGVVRDGSEALFYVCGAKASNVGGWTRWFATDEWTDNGLVIDRDGWLLRAHVDGQRIDVDVDGPLGQAGSWETEQDASGGVFSHLGDCRNGAIVSGAAITGAWCSPEREFFQVEPVDTLVPSDLGVLMLRPIGVEDAPAFEAVRVEL